MVDPNQLPDFFDQLASRQGELEHLRQNALLNESQFINFSKDCGVPVSGVGSGDPGQFVTRGWLKSDQALGDKPTLFHPFRMYPLNVILLNCRLQIAASASLQRDRMLGLVERILKNTPNLDRIEQMAHKANRVVDLAILLEPIYWPRITGWERGTVELTDHELSVMRSGYREAVLQLVGGLEPDSWRKIHESLRVEAAIWDQNSDLYLLLRLSSWEQRKGLKGNISGALWLRHIAETIRRAFEDAHGVEWEEEDLAFGFWPVGARKVALGSERPLDRELKSMPHIAWAWGLFTGSVVRWYVEGDTEYHAMRYVLPEPSLAGIELLNLKGMIRAEKGNVALSLEQLLIEDKALRRFSVISFDLDVQQNVKVVRRQVSQHNVVGLIAAHKPDFEFANFTIGELIEVAARIDETFGGSGELVRKGNWRDVHNAGLFEERYKQVTSVRASALKGKGWGEALAAYAVENPKRTDDGQERPFWGEIRAALNARTAHYDFQKEHFGIDADTFEQVDLRKSEEPMKANNVEEEELEGISPRPK